MKTPVSVALSLVDDGVFLRVKPFYRDVKQDASESDELFQQLTEADREVLNWR